MFEYGRGAGEIFANFTQILPIRSNLRAKNNMLYIFYHYTIGNKRDESYVGNTRLITWVRPVISDDFALIYIVKSILSYALRQLVTIGLWPETKMFGWYGYLLFVQNTMKNYFAADQFSPDY